MPVNREHLIPQYAREYVEGNLKNYAFFTTELVKGLPPETAFAVLEKFTLEVNRLLRDNRGTTTKVPRNH